MSQPFFPPAEPVILSARPERDEYWFREGCHIDVVIIPPGCRQRIRNPGDKDLEFLAICSPRFRESNYRDQF